MNISKINEDDLAKLKKEDVLAAVPSLNNRLYKIYHDIIGDEESVEVLKEKLEKKRLAGLFDKFSAEENKRFEGDMLSREDWPDLPSPKVFDEKTQALAYPYFLITNDYWYGKRNYLKWTVSKEEADENNKAWSSIYEREEERLARQALEEEKREEEIRQDEERLREEKERARKAEERLWEATSLANESFGDPDSETRPVYKEQIGESAFASLLSDALKSEKTEEKEKQPEIEAEPKTKAVTIKKPKVESSPAELEEVFDPAKLSEDELLEKYTDNEEEIELILKEYADIDELFAEYQGIQERIQEIDDSLPDLISKRDMMRNDQKKKIYKEKVDNMRQEKKDLIAKRDSLKTRKNSLSEIYQRLLELREEQTKIEEVL